MTKNKREPTAPVSSPHLAADQFAPCMEACLLCSRECEAALKLGPALGSPRLRALVRDCAVICRAAAEVLQHGGELATAVCQTCEAACRVVHDACLREDANVPPELAATSLTCAGLCAQIATPSKLTKG